MPHPEYSPDLHAPESHLPEAAVEKPFAIVLHRKDLVASGYFRPDATVTLSRALRTSGLLLAVPPEEVKSLVLMLTFVTPNGWCQPTVPQLADAMHVSEAKARAWMQRLLDFRWQGRPLVTEIKRGSGMDGFTLSPAVVSLQAAPEPLQEAIPSLPPSNRDTIIARSRALYARPRAEVERMIAEQMGWKEQGDGPEAQIRRKLLAVAGLMREQVDLLLERYPHERIERQLEWLPHRNAKSPARFLMAAVENDYDPPPVVRLQRDAARTTGDLEGGPQKGTAQTAPPDQKQGETEREPIQEMGRLEIPELSPAQPEQSPAHVE